jgi:hypothetical protein
LTGADGLRDLTLHRSRAPDGTINERWQIDNEMDLRMFQSMQRPSDAPLMDALNTPDPPPSARASRPTVTVIAEEAPHYPPHRPGTVVSAHARYGRINPDVDQQAELHRSLQDRSRT